MLTAGVMFRICAEVPKVGDPVCLSTAANPARSGFLDSLNAPFLFESAVIRVPLYLNRATDLSNATNYRMRGSCESKGLNLKKNPHSELAHFARGISADTKIFFTRRRKTVPGPLDIVKKLL
jgi:hypothetical protein